MLIKVRKRSTAPDMKDEEIAAVEQFLRPESRSESVGEPIAWRDYLMWRMAIEFGIRKSEILAMRLSDCLLEPRPTSRSYASKSVASATSIPDATRLAPKRSLVI